MGDNSRYIEQSFQLIMSDKLKVTRIRTFAAHHMLIGAAKCALEDAEKKMPGWFYSELIVLSMCALSIEAICNVFGKHLIQDWTVYKTKSPKEKLEIICRNTDIPYDKNQEPWSTAMWLCKLRNDIAHAKPEFVDKTYIWTRKEYENRRMDYPQSKLESHITLGNARRALRAIESIKDIFCDKIPPEMRRGLVSDGWSGSAGPS